MLLLSRLVRRDDRGSALMGVLALVGVTGVIAVTVGTVSVSSLQTTNSVAASVEARGAAEAGINAAELALRPLTGCPASGAITRTAEPAYTVTIEHDIGNGWEPGCPPPDATLVRFISTGSAERPTFDTANSGAERVIEAVYQHIPASIVPPVVDPAVYAYTINSVLKKFVLDSADISIAADLQIKTGDFECSNNARVSGDVILGDGFANLSMCSILGTLHAEQYVVMNKSEVTGDVIATGVGVAASGTTVDLTAGSEIDGNIFAGGSVSVDGSLVRGGVVAAKNTSTTVKVKGTVLGNVQSTGLISGNGTFGGTKVGSISGLAAPTSASVPEWTDIPWGGAASFPTSTWAANGFVNVIPWVGPCTFDNNTPLWATLNSITVPTVIDAMGCTGGITTLNNLDPDIFLRTDIAFFADKFQFDKLYFESSDPAVKRDVYFIVPDNVDDDDPTCTGESGGIYITNEADIKSSVSAFAYTPCKIQSDRDGWRGQFYGGEVEFDQQAQMTFVPTSPPGIDFTGAGNPPPPAPPRLGDRISIREVASGG